ncbi:unnamed protein product, partial [Mesorhabditis spiculigera]
MYNALNGYQNGQHAQQRGPMQPGLGYQQPNNAMVPQFNMTMLNQPPPGTSFMPPTLPHEPGRQAMPYAPTGNQQPAQQFQQPQISQTAIPPLMSSYTTTSAYSLPPNHGRAGFSNDTGIKRKLSIERSESEKSGKVHEDRKRRGSRSPEDRKRRRPRRSRSPTPVKTARTGPAGGSVTALLQKSDRQEEEIRRLGAELEKLKSQHGLLQNEIGTLRSDKIKMKSDFERANRSLAAKNTECENLKKNDINQKKQHEFVKTALTKAREDAEKEQKRATEAVEKSDAILSELDFLKGRNEVLVKKCEELIDKNRAMVDTKDEALRLVEAAKKEAEIREHEMKMKLDHIDRLEKDLSIVHNKEILWQRDREEMSRALETKDRLLVTERGILEKEYKREKGARERLEVLLKKENPEEADTFMGLELLNRTLDTVKTEIEEQFRILRETALPYQEAGPSNARSEFRRALSEPLI